MVAREKWSKVQEGESVGGAPKTGRETGREGERGVPEIATIDTPGEVLDLPAFWPTVSE